MDQKYWHKEQFNELVDKEREKQDEKWGEQNHNAFIWLAILGEEFGELQKAVLENYFSAYYDTSADQIERELIQVVAVAKAMWEAGKNS